MRRARWSCGSIHGSSYLIFAVPCALSRRARCIRVRSCFAFLHGTPGLARHVGQFTPMGPDRWDGGLTVFIGYLPDVVIPLPPDTGGGSETRPQREKVLIRDLPGGY